MQHDDYWATRTGRWRRALRGQEAPSFCDRLYEVIKADIGAGALPGGARLPSVARVAAELSVQKASVNAAYERMAREQLAELRNDGEWHVVSQGVEPHLGDATQIRMESALLRSVREVAAKGMAAHEPQRLSDVGHPNDRKQ
jgi:DNA-binding transcriptional regulator YhcF (GntR family)